MNFPKTLPWLEIPHTAELVYDNTKTAPANLTTSCATLLKDTQRNGLWLAHIRNRNTTPDSTLPADSPDLPGGHVEPGETPEAAAHRETVEETGITPLNLKPLAYVKITLLAKPPKAWKYPTPVSYMQYFTAEAGKATPFTENQECKTPLFLSLMPHADPEPIIRNWMERKIEEDSMDIFILRNFILQDMLSH